MRLPRWFKKALRVALVVMITALIVVIAAIYLWPVRNSRLQHGSGTRDTYAEAVAAFGRIHQQEVSNPAVRPECRSQLLQHGHSTARAVVMYHGYSNCPEEFSALAQYFFDHGYNVYVPRAPYHGLTDRRAHGKVTGGELVDYADQATTLGSSGLGEELGVAGLSGGGVLATWSAIYRADVVKRALIISPFYKPSASQLPAWEARPFLMLYGYGWLPDRFNSGGLSYHALAQYVMIADNLFGQPRPALRSTAMVLSAGDKLIDQQRARSVIRLLSADPEVYVPPTAWGLGHDIVDPGGVDIHGHAGDLYPLYLQLYDGLRP